MLYVPNKFARWTLGSFDPPDPASSEIGASESIYRPSVDPGRDLDPPLHFVSSKIAIALSSSSRASFSSAAFIIGSRRRQALLSAFWTRRT